MSAETRTIGLGTITHRDDGVLHTVFDFEGEPSVELAEEYVKARYELVGESPVPVIVEIIRIPYTQREVRGFFVQGVGRATCRAVVTADRSYRVMFKTFDQMFDDAVPTSFFTSVDDAVEWIDSLVDTPPEA